MAPARSLADLPEEMLIHIATRVAASSDYLMAYLRSLRGACSLMRDKVCGAALVRRSINMRLVLQQSYNAAISERLIVNNHGAGNLEALFIMGMRVVFRRHGGALDALLDDLDRATRRGHKTVAYLLAVLLWRANCGAKDNFQAKELLAEVADEDPALAVLNDRGVSLPHEHIFHTMWRYVWPIWHTVACVPPSGPRTEVHHCASPYRQ